MVDPSIPSSRSRLVEILSQQGWPHIAKARMAPLAMVEVPMYALIADSALARLAYLCR